MWEIKVEESIAKQDLDNLLDKKRIKPSRRVDLEKCIAVIIEAITFGYVSINEDGSISQKLICPVNQFEAIEYKSRVEPSAIQSKLSLLKVDNYNSRLMVYTQAYTGCISSQINSLEPCDKETCEAITTLFL